MTPADFEKMLETYEKDVFNFCKHLTYGEYHKACDLYQETVLHAFERRAKIDKNNNPRAFLFAIAVGKWKNSRRKGGRRNSIAPEVELAEGVNERASSSENPEKKLEEKIQKESINRAIARLKDKFRIPLLLFYFQQWSIQDIAQVLEIPEGTVKSRLHKARSLLKVSLEEEGVKADG